jgi:signal peptidase I
MKIKFVCFLLVCAIIQTFAFYAFFVLPIRAFIISPTKASGYCMYPTIDIVSNVWLNKTAYLFSGPDRGDIVSFKKDGMKKPYIKRIIGLPGETIDIYDKTVFIDGNELFEPYTWLPTYGDYGPTTIPDGHVFVMGDNRNNSIDSRDKSIGMVPIKNIQGVVLLASSRSNHYNVRIENRKELIYAEID